MRTYPVHHNLGNIDTLYTLSARKMEEAREEQRRAFLEGEYSLESECWDKLQQWVELRNRLLLMWAAAFREDVAP